MTSDIRSGSLFYFAPGALARTCPECRGRGYFSNNVEGDAPDAIECESCGGSGDIV